MKRSGLIALFLTLVSVNFVSAAFSISNEFSSIDPSTMVLGFLFVIFAWLIQTGLTRAGPFKYNRIGAGMISISLSMLMIYGIDRFGWNYYSFFNGVLFFVPEGLIETVWPILFLVLLVGSFWKLGKHALLFWGIFLIGLSIFFAYEWGYLSLLGGFFIFLYLIWLFLGRKKKPTSDVGGNNYPPERPPSRSTPRSSSGPGFFGRRKNKAKQSAGWFGNKAKTAGAGIGKGASWAKNKATNVGREWTRRDQAMREKMAKTQQQKTQTVTKQQQTQQKTQTEVEKLEKRLSKVMALTNKLSVRKPGSPKISKLQKEALRIRTELQRLRSQ